MKKLKKKVYYSDYLFIAPAVILITVFFISSIIYTFLLSFFDWDGVTDWVFCGLKNYTAIFTDENFVRAVINTIVWVVSSLATQLLLPLLLAILITRSYFSKTFKNILYFPHTLSGTVGGIIFLSLFSSYGIPMLFGLQQQNWLNTPYLNTFLLILSNIWQGVGLNLLLFLAGFHNMDTSPIESAMIDGCSGVKLYTKVVLPIIRPTIIVVMLMTVVNSFKIFDVIWVTTKGGPYRTSETLAISMYQESFIYNRLGRGAAVAIVLTVVILFFSYFYIKNTFNEDQ